MKIIAIRFPAYGPFTDFTLEFGDSPGLQVVYGPNESGKTSSLRALEAFFYGIESRTDDNFVHPYNRLQIGARLQHSNGRTLELIRRKGSKNTLRTTDEETVPENELSGFTGGLSKAVFQRLYGLDHRTLESGGRALLQDDGNVGESLFAANIGPAFRQLRERLRTESDGIWTQQSRTKKLNDLQDEWRACQEIVREHQLSASEFKKVVDEVEGMERARAQTQKTLTESETRLTTLRERQTALPRSLRRKELRDELEEYSDLPQLSSDFAARYAKIESEFNEVEIRRESAEANQKRLQEKLADLPAEWPILEFTGLLRDLPERIGQNKSLETELPSLEEKLSSTEKEIERFLTDLGYPTGQEPSVLPTKASQERVRKLVKSSRDLDHKRLNYDEAIRRGQRDLERIKSELDNLEDLSDCTELGLLLHQADRASNWESRLNELQHQFDKQNRSLQEKLQRLPHWSGTLDDLTALAIPSESNIQHHLQTLEHAHRRLEQASRETARLHNEVQQRTKELEESVSSGEVLSEKMLLQLRDARRVSFHQVLERWRAGESPDEARESLLAYSRAVVAADTYAERMVNEARPMAIYKQRCAELEKVQDQAKRAHKAEEEQRRQLEQAEREWRNLWVSDKVHPTTPAEMLSWLKDRTNILNEALDLDEYREEIQQLRQERDQLQGELRDELAKFTTLELPTSTPLNEIVSYLKDQLSRAQHAAGQRKTLSEQLTEVQRQLDEAEANQNRFDIEQQTWDEEWQRSAKEFFPTGVPSPDTLDKQLQLFDGLRQRREQRTELRERLAKLQTERTLFSEQITELVEKFPECREEHSSLLLQANVLQQTFLEALNQAERRREFEEELAEIEKALIDWQERSKLAQSQVATLLQEAGATELSELPRIIERSHRRDGHIRTLHEVEEALRSLSGGVPLEEFCVSLSQTEPQELEQEIQALTQRVEDLKIERDQKLTRLVELREVQKQMDGSDRAILAAEQAAQTITSASALIERYVRLRLADRILNDEIERYREKNEKPILQRSSDYFSKLTCGAYTQLIAAYDEKGTTRILQAASNTGRVVNMEGLSEGTRSQLFLSLRLATIEERSQNAEPFPIIADDLLIHFDEERAFATLKVLAEFAKAHQVILFTHLDRDRTLAQRLGPELAAVHTLERLQLK